MNASAFREAMKKRGYRSILELAAATGVHRNIVHGYLSGKPVLPGKLERLLEALDLRLDQAIVWSPSRPPRGTAPIAELVDQLHDRHPDTAFVLFGSRARAQHAPYADWDIGVFRPAGLEHATYRQMRAQVAEAAERQPTFVDLVNLNRAETEFLRSISRDWQLLAGRHSAWLALQERAAHG